MDHLLESNVKRDHFPSEMLKLPGRHTPQATRVACRRRRQHVPGRIVRAHRNGKRIVAGPAACAGGGRMMWHLPPLPVAARLPTAYA